MQVRYLELLLQFLPQSVQLVQTLAQVDVSVEPDEGFDEIRNAPLGFHVVAAAETQRSGYTVSMRGVGAGSGPGSGRYLSRALDRAFCRLVEAAGKGNLTAMLRQ